MKLFVILFLAIVLTKAHPKEVPTKAFNNVVTRGINEKLVELIESFKEILKNGNDSLGFPVMDPLVMDHQEVSLNSEIFRGDLAIDKMKISALSEYEVQKAKFAIVGLKLTLGMRWAEIKGTTAYNLKGVALNFFDIYGAGNLKFFVENLSFLTNIAISTNPESKTMFIKAMTTSVSLGDLQVTIDGLFNDNDLSDVTSAIISDLAPGIVQTYQKKLTETINTVVMSEANKVLSTMTLKDLLALIQ